MVSDIYQPLRTDEVRFLRLLPGRKIAAELEIRPLREAKSYIALSSTWGNAPSNSRLPKALYDIILNDRCFKVQENLYDALTYLAPAVRLKECLFWVDAICINQSDVEERNAQILHMEVSTIISPDDTDIFPEIADSDCYRGWLRIKELFQHLYWRTRGSIRNPPTPGINQSSVEIILSAWFSSAPMSPWPITSWSAFVRLPEVHHLEKMARFRTNGVVRYGDSFLELLEFLHLTQCSKPRDKVYAILGMAVDLSDPNDFAPDHSESVADVYTDIFRYSLSRADNGLQCQRHLGARSSSAAEVQAWTPGNPNDIYQPTGQNRDEAFRTTVCADFNMSTKSRGDSVDWSVTDAHHDTLTADESSRKSEVDDALTKASGCRRLCWTKIGRIGLVPDVAQVGDLLYVLWGGQMLHVVRRKEAGESYVHGVMDGELVTDETGDGETIVLE
ncbi:MAG: hypothetical protein Q9204_004376 [Flavoplaca sp. TL-2023a]